MLSPSTIREYRHFYPRPPGGGRPRFDHLAEHTNRFLSTPSGWRATRMCGRWRTSLWIFLSTPSGWRATLTAVAVVLHRVFLSTPSGWRATGTCKKAVGSKRFLSTPSGWRATKRRGCARDLRPISIHALRVEGDGAGTRKRTNPPISIHALRVEGDRNQRSHQRKQRDFYPRPPGGGRRRATTKCTRQ